MPTYEYACRGCGEHVEVVQSFRDDPLTECGLCGGPLRKVFSAAGIIFKGSGYYVTDTRSKAAETTPDSTGEAKSGETKSGDAKSSETKSGNAKSGETSAESA